MFAVVAVLNSLLGRREGREALAYENYIRTGQEIPSRKIYRESSTDKRARKELAAVRYKERLERQIKFVRLMKKLLIEADRVTPDGEIDEELEQMRIKVAQLAVKVEHSACENNINYEDMFNMNKPDDAYDIELEKILRTSSSARNFEKIPSTTTTEAEEKHHIDESSGDHVRIHIHPIIKHASEHGDQLLVERKRKTKT